jgi:hypothetical protein
MDWIGLRLKMTAVVLREQTLRICVCQVIRQKYVNMQILVSEMTSISKT